jgi:hypothetical protein
MCTSAKADIKRPKKISRHCWQNNIDIQRKGDCQDYSNF